MTDLKVDNDMVVSMDYVLTVDGDVLDASQGEPLSFLQGHGNIISGLEEAMYGMTLGDTQDVQVAPVDGYGEHDPENYETVPRDMFPDDLQLQIGMMLNMRDQETDEVYKAYVKEVASDTVLLDFNHPLAGKTLHFSVEVVGLRSATAEEIAHGHVHD